MSSCDSNCDVGNLQSLMGPLMPVVTTDSTMTGEWRYMAFICACVWPNIDAARILFVIPTPSISHQVVFRPVSQELARRGHHVVVLTTDPAFPPNQAPANFTEIDLHDVSYVPWIDRFLKTATGKQNDLYTQVYTAFDLMVEIFAIQMRTDAVQRLLGDVNERFDLVIAESWTRPALALAYVYKAPVIWMSSFGAMDEQYALMGVPINPIAYPDFVRARILNLTLWEKVSELYNRYLMHRLIMSYEELEDVMLREVFGAEIPPVRELKQNVELLMVNMDPVFEGYRPVPPNVVHLGSLNCAPQKELPKELETWMNSSKHGVIYMSFGTNTDPALLPADRIAVFSRVFSQLPYDVLWKYKNPPAGLSSNVRTSEWLPQPDLLRHGKLVLFITQAGLQSTDEALRASVPLLAFPMLGDQWFNSEQYERLGVGRRLELASLTDEQLRSAIDGVINDKSYRERSKWLSEEMQDRPETSLERAVWWIERVLRRRGRRMRAPSVSISWMNYVDTEILVAAIVLVAGVMVVAFGLFKLLPTYTIKVKTK